MHRTVIKNTLHLMLLSTATCQSWLLKALGLCPINSSPFALSSLRAPPLSRILLQRSGQSTSPFCLGPFFAIDMCVGSLILFIMDKLNKSKVHAFGSAVASGLKCGQRIWTLPNLILALAGVKPPIFPSYFLSKFLGNKHSFSEH